MLYLAMVVNGPGEKPPLHQQPARMPFL